jgi:hypothetical protein
MKFIDKTLVAFFTLTLSMFLFANLSVAESDLSSKIKLYAELVENPEAK